MKLAGYRRDGTMLVLIPGGMAVLLRGEMASPPLDVLEADRYGPWRDDGTLTLAERNELGHMLDRARTVPLALLSRMDFADAAVAEKEDEKKDAPAPEKGEYLKRVKEVAKRAQAIIDREGESDTKKDAPPAEAPGAPEKPPAPAESPAPPPTVPPQAPPEKAEKSEPPFEKKDKDDEKPAPMSSKRKFKLEFEEESGPSGPKVIGEEPDITDTTGDDDDDEQKKKKDDDEEDDGSNTGYGDPNFDPTSAIIRR